MELNKSLAEALKKAISEAESENAEILKEKGELPLYDYQVPGRDFIVEKRRCIVGDEMGLGKTIQALAAVCKFDPIGTARILVVATKNAKAVWQQEIKKWLDEDAEIVDTSAGLITYSMQFLEPTHRFLICNYEQMRVCKKHILSNPWNVIIFDEAHRMRNKKTGIREAAKEICKHFAVTPIIMITGTPLVNTPTDLWSLLNLLDGYTFDSENRFIDAFFYRYGYGNSAKNYRFRPGAEMRFQDYMSNFMIRRERKDVLDLPPIQKITTPNFLEGDQLRIYKEIRDSWMAEIGSNEAIMVTALIAQITRLKQICLSEKLMLPDFECCDGVKTESVVEMLEEWQGKVVITSQFTRYLKPLKKRLEAEGHICGLITGETPEWKRAEQVAEFQKENSPMNIFLLSMGAGGESITLTAANRLEFMDLPWTPATADQVFSRIYRIGQESKVVRGYHRAENTIEQYIEEVIGHKRMLFNQSIPVTTVRRMMLGHD